MAAAGQGVVGLRSRGGRKGCTKRLAKKASGFEQEKTGQNRRQTRGRRSQQAGEQAGPASEQVNTKGGGWAGPGLAHQR